MQFAYARQSYMYHERCCEVKIWGTDGGKVVLGQENAGSHLQRTVPEHHLAIEESPFKL